LLKNWADVRAGPSYLLFPIALALAICVALAIHIRYKPADMDWLYYDPHFVYALKETPEAFAGKSCQQNNALGFGTSLLDFAVAVDGGNWIRWNKWRRYSGVLDNMQHVDAIVHSGGADLRLFYPMLALLPDCPKVIVLHTESLLPSSMMNRDTWQYLRGMLLDGPRFYLGSMVERWWNAPYQVAYHKPFKHRPQKDESFNSTVFSRTYQLRGKLREIKPQHRDIIMRLVENHAQVLILDIERSRPWEEAGATQMASFRDVVRTFASDIDGVHYRRFSSIEGKYYEDFKHLNNDGAQVFRPWMAATLAELSASSDGFR
jgi:hypothetical protein